MKKYRNEIKFRINKNDAIILAQRLSLILDIDKNAYYDDGSYSIKSLYFDDREGSSYFEKIDGVLYRKKYRIRIYNDDESFIRLEKKMKYNNMSVKESQLISKELYDKILSGNINDIDCNDDLLGEFIREMKLKSLVPSVIVQYQRLAFIYPVSDVRITIDFNVQSGRYNYDLFDKNLPMFRLDEKDKYILEVKFNEVLPLHIARILESMPSSREAISKFALCRSIK